MIESMNRERSIDRRRAEASFEVSASWAERLFESYEAEVFGFLVRFLERRSLAEDALQDTFLRVLRRSEQELAALDNPRAWLFTLARRAAVDVIRKESRREGSLDAARSSAVLAAMIAPDRSWQSLAEEERQRLVQQALAVLDLEEREALLLLARGLSYREIGRALDCSHPTAKRRVTLALAAFTRALVRYRIFDEEDL